jgi:hypothetical protein
VIIVAVVVFLLLAACVAFGFINSGLEARSAAGAAIGSAQTIWNDAQLAVEPGSSGLTTSQESAAALANAKSLFDSGYYVLADKYKAAQQEAEKAGALAQGILDNVALLNEQAGTATSSDAIAIYFSLYTQYPRTNEGQGALEAAAQVLVNDTYYGDIEAIEAVANFVSDCPGDVPESVFTFAKEHVASAADASISSQTSIANNNVSWAKKMLTGKRISFSAGGTTSSETADLSSIISKLSAIGAEDYRDALVLIRDSSKLGQKCAKTASSPVRRTGSLRLYTRGQVNSIKSNSAKMQSKLKSAKAKLDALSS